MTNAKSTHTALIALREYCASFVLGADAVKEARSTLVTELKEHLSAPDAKFFIGVLPAFEKTAKRAYRARANDNDFANFCADSADLKQDLTRALDASAPV